MSDREIMDAKYGRDSGKVVKDKTWLVYVGAVPVIVTLAAEIDGVTGETALILKSPIEDKVAKDMTGLMYVGTLVLKVTVLSDKIVATVATAPIVKSLPKLAVAGAVGIVGATGKTKSVQSDTLLLANFSNSEAAAWYTTAFLKSESSFIFE